jgi:hypothetical protein
MGRAELSGVEMKSFDKTTSGRPVLIYMPIVLGIIICWLWSGTRHLGEAHRITI